MSRVKKNVAASRALGTKMDKSASKVVSGLRSAARSGRYGASASRTSTGVRAKRS